MAELVRVRLLIAAGDTDGAAAALPAARSAPAVAVQAGVARLKLATDDPYGALEALDRTRPDHAHTRIELLILEAFASKALGRPEAHMVFEAALAAAEASKHRAVLLDFHEPLRPLLLDAIRHGTAHRAVVGELLDLLDDREPPPVAVEWNDHLSDRESSVLRFLGSGLSNREIANELLISTNTVKTHARSIYRKLDVADRRAAVERAHMLGLLRSAPMPSANGDRRSAGGDRVQRE